MPKKPTGMSAFASDVWDRVGPELVRIGKLTVVDGEAFASYCELAWENVRLQRLVNALRSMTQKAPSGYDQIHPLVAQRNKVLESLDRFHRKFGITPGARGDEGIPETTGEKRDQASAFFSARTAGGAADVGGPEGPIPIRPRAG